MIKKPGVLLLILIPLVIAAQETDPFEYSPFENDSFSGTGTVNALSADGALVTVAVILYYSGGEETHSELVAKSYFLRERIEGIISKNKAYSLNKPNLEKLILKDFKKHLNNVQITGVVFSAFKISDNVSIPEINDF